MNVALLDVNVLVALVWPAHESHNKVQHWFQQHAAATKAGNGAEKSKR
jgi:predicted nucleic acid-binding protein